MHADSTGSSRTYRSTSSASTERCSANDGISDITKHAMRRGGDSHLSQRSKGIYQRGRNRGEAEGGRDWSKTATRGSVRKPTKAVDEQKHAKNASRQPCMVHNEDNSSVRSKDPQNSSDLSTKGIPQSAAATGPEAAKEMRRAILCLLMYSHRQENKYQHKRLRSAQAKGGNLYCRMQCSAW